MRFFSDVGQPLSDEIQLPMIHMLVVPANVSLSPSFVFIKL